MNFDRILLIATLIVSIFGVYLNSVQVIPVKNSIAKETRLAISYCLEDFNRNRELQDGSTTTCKTILKDNGYIFRTEIPETLNFLGLGVEGLTITKGIIEDK